MEFEEIKMRDETRKMIRTDFLLAGWGWVLFTLILMSTVLVSIVLIVLIIPMIYLLKLNYQQYILTGEIIETQTMIDMREEKKYTKKQFKKDTGMTPLQFSRYIRRSRVTRR